MSLTDAISIPGYKFIGRTKDDTWGKWIIDDGNTSEAEREAWQQQQQLKRQQRAADEAKQRAESMPAAERDYHYRRLLAQLTLHSDDRADLHRRGVTDEQIQRWGVKSVEQWQQLSIELPHTLPGVSLDGRSLSNYYAGYLIPAQSPRREITGSQIATRDRSEDAPKYPWLTSKTRKRQNGPQPNLPNGELPLTVAFPAKLDMTKAGQIGFCEGTGVKPCLAADKTGIPVIGASGGNFVASSELLRTYIQELAEFWASQQPSLGSNKTCCVLFPDAGSPKNKNVMRQYRATWRLVQRWNYAFEVAWWGQESKEDSDIDELQELTGISYLTVAQWESIVAGRDKQRFEAIANRFAQRLQKWLAPKQPKPRLATSLPSEEFQPYLPGKLPRYTSSYQFAFEFEAGQRADFYREAIEKGWGHILDVSPTGTAKSTTAGQLKPGDFVWTGSDGEKVGAEHIFYLDSNHRNPSVLEIEQNFTDLPVRHTGLAIDPSRTTAGGKPHTRHAKEGEELERTPGNCYRAPLFVAAKQRGLHWAEAEAEQNPICGQCPHFHICGKPMSIGLSGQGYRAARRQALQQPRIRLSPDSTPIEGFENRVNIWEEATALFQPAESRTATITDFNSQWAALEAGDKDSFDRLFPVRQKLRQLMGSQESWGFNLDRIRQELGEIPEWLNARAIHDIEETITPTVQEVLGESYRRIKVWIERCSKRFTDLQRKLKEAQNQIDQHEHQFGGFKDFRLGDDDAVRELRQQAEQLRLQVEECKSEIAEATRQLTEAEHNRAKRQEHRVQAEQALLDTETQWLPDFLRIWIGLRPGAARIAQGKLILTQRNDRHLNQIQGTKNIYLDSSAHRNILAAHLGTAPEALLVCRQKSAAVANIQRIQIVGFGLAGKQRAETTDQRIATTIEALLLQHNLTRDDALIIDHRAKREATGANLHHFGGRGTNEFKEKKILINIGSPIENIGAAQDRYRVLENPGISFEHYLASFTEAEQMQEEGRLRANLRPEQNLIAAYIGDHALPFPDVEILQAIDVASAAADRTQAARRRITTAICEVFRTGIKLTQQAIAAAAKCHQSWISQFFAKHGGWYKWKKIISGLLKTVNNTTDISPELLESLLPAEAEMIAWLETTVPEGVDQPQELLPNLGDWLSCEEVDPKFSFDRVLAALSLPVRKAIVAALLLAAMPNLDSGGQSIPG